MIASFVGKIFVLRDLTIKPQNVSPPPPRKLPAIWASTFLPHQTGEMIFQQANVDFSRNAYCATHIVVLINVNSVDCRFNGCVLIELTYVAPDIGIVHYLFLVALHNGISILVIHTRYLR